MKLQGNITQVQLQLEALISIFGKNAKIADVENILILAVSLYTSLKGGQPKRLEVG